VGEVGGGGEHVGEVGGVVGEGFDVEEEGSGDVLGEEVGVGVGGGAGGREGGVEDDGVGVVEAGEEVGGGEEWVHGGIGFRVPTSQKRDVGHPAEIRGSFAALEDDGEKQTTARAIGLAQN